MTLVRRIARPMLAATFVHGGYDQLRHPDRKVARAASVLRSPAVHRLVEQLHLPDNPELLVRANGAAMVMGGALLGTGRVPRLASLVLAGTLLPTTWAGHPFWQEKDPVARANQRVHFEKNLGLLGGVLLAAVDTAGKPGVTWRAQRAAKDAKRAAALTGRHARQTARQTAREAKREAKLAVERIH